MHRAALLLFLVVAACATRSTDESPADRFFERLSALCGKAFEGRIASPPVAADAAFAGRRLIMQVRSCSAREIKIPFHVGEDRSRTWVVTRAAGGLKLEHDHRHADGSEDRLSRYGGEAAAPGTAGRQAFPAGDFSKALFLREGIEASTANVWAIEVGERRFAYELRRPGRYFRVEFDLSRPVPPPPAPWGSG